MKNIRFIGKISLFNILWSNEYRTSPIVSITNYVTPGSISFTI